MLPCNLFSASILLNEGGVSDPEVLAAAILHDTVEDTDTTEEEVPSVSGITSIIRSEMNRNE